MFGIKTAIMKNVIANSSTQPTSVKKCLILSDGPVPTPEHTKVEGGGLRSWGLAKGIKNNDPHIDITVAYNDTYKLKERFTKEHQGIHITTWTLETIPKLLAGFDSIIVSYCMGELSVVVANSVRPNHQLILDCYVPIYVEVSARESADLDSEYGAFHHDVPRWGQVLRRGDLFLCASEPQKKFYEGVLAGLGRINPATYGEDLIYIVPYGIYKEKPKQKNHPIQQLIGPEHDTYKKILWFGGIYPWFDLKDLIDAVAKVNEQIPSKLIIVGAKNPFNTHPDFLRKYDELMSYIKDNKLENMVLVQDWVPFETRADWYLGSDLVVVINKLGQENSLAWRTRLVDFAWANLPIITNGGDPVSNLLREAHAVSFFQGLSADEMADDIVRLLRDKKELSSIKKNLENVRKELYWDTVTKQVAESITIHSQPGDFARFGLYEHIGSGTGVKAKLKKLSHKVRKVPAYTRKYGLKSTIYTTASVLERKVKKHLPRKDAEGPRVVIVSHQLDMSGAPFVIMDFAIDLKKTYPKLPIEFYTFNPVHYTNITTLNKHGIRPKILVDQHATIDFNDGDVVVFNTSAQSPALKSQVFGLLEKNRLSKLFWYVHEDEPELIFSKNEASYINSLMLKGKIEILSAAVKTRDHYRAYFHNDKNITTQAHHVITPKKYHRILKADDFSKKLSFLLPGTIGDGRKGQLPIFYAFADFYHNTYSKHPEHYRDFELVYVGITDDFLSRQILKHAPKALGGRFVWYGRVTKEEIFGIYLKSNMTLCYSIRECLPLFVFEGMIAGHPILRNDSSGMEEQLVEGKNGYLLDSSDYEQVKAMIEKMLDKRKTTDKQLEKMSKASYDIALAQETHSYEKLAKHVKEALHAKK